MNISRVKNSSLKVLGVFGFSIALIGSYVFFAAHFATATALPTYTIEGYKYQCYEDGDFYCNDGYEGWTIYAQNGDSEPIQTTTDETGYYSFTVAAGTWEVSEEERSNWEQVEVKQNGDVITASSCTFEIVDIEEPILDLVGFVGIAYAESALYSCDFGNQYVPTFPVRGLKWNDSNANGLQDEGETGVEGWKITADDGDGQIVEVMTEENGEYTLELEAGAWTISEELRSGWTQTAVFQNDDVVEGSTCSFEIGYVSRESRKSIQIIDEDYAPTCVFLNHEEPRRSGGSSGTRVKDRATPQPLVLGEATSTPSCGMYLNDYMRMGKEASSTEVTKLQVFLNAVGITAPLTGVFDAATDAAVRSFQMKHKAEVLTPWYMAKIVPHENPTGWVYQLTRWKINNIVCPGSEAYPVLN